jgi:surface polysaccharide O-acyltransferase-like enzyme
MDAEHLSAVKRGDIEAAHKPISPALRSGPSAVSGATRQEQIPSIEIISKDEIPLILESKPRDRLHYLDNFRAIAITTIIFGHCYSGWHRDTYWEQALSNALTGGTALFVFISGFFFHAVFRAQFDFRRFMRKKTLNVALPYLILTGLLLTAYYILSDKIWFPSDLDRYDLGNDLKILVNILIGWHLTGYWYIPFVMLLFLASPVVMAFTNLKHSWQAIIVVLLLTLSMLFHRPMLNINPVHSLVYFFPFYLSGAIYSQNRITANLVLERIPAALSIAWLATVLLMTNAGEVGNSHKWIPWDYTGIDWMVPQKMILIFLLISLLLRYGSHRSAVMGTIASHSFPLFFIHPWVLLFFDFTNITEILTGGLRGFLLLSAVVLTCSLLASALIRASLRDNARYVIGA